MLAARIDRLTVAPGALALWSLGQAGVVIKAAGAVLYVDPGATVRRSMRAASIVTG